MGIPDVKPDEQTEKKDKKDKKRDKKNKKDKKEEKEKKKSKKIRNDEELSIGQEINHTESLLPVAVPHAEALLPLVESEQSLPAGQTAETGRPKQGKKKDKD